MFLDGTIDFNVNGTLNSTVDSDTMAGSVYGQSLVTDLGASSSVGTAGGWPGVTRYGNHHCCHHHHRHHHHHHQHYHHHHHQQHRQKSIKCPNRMPAPNK